MAKKKRKISSKELSEPPEYEKLTTFDQIDQEIIRHKEILYSRDFLERRIKDEKKSQVSWMNEQLKEVAQEREHEMGILEALNDRKRQLNAQPSAPVLSFHPRAQSGD